MKDILLMLLVLAGICAAGFCAGVETGFLSVSRVRLLPLVRQHSKRARQLAKALRDMSRVVTTLLVGNNIAAVTVSTASTALALRMFGSSPLFQAVWALFVAALMLFGGEYLPKLLFATRPLRRSLAAMRAYRALEFALAPLVAVFSAVTRVVFKVRPTRSGRLGVSRAGLRTLISDKEGSTRLTPFERTLIARVLDLQALSAADLMHPAAPADAVPALRIASRTRGDDILPLMRRVRQPVASVFDEATGEIVGVVSEEDVLLALTGVLKEG
ncbi:MAG: DUF21 domain-containing protein [Kiritimatiellae bacterium]|nr:DUF21 domain-containing protein [Kiritimatiellia bacterium]